MSNRYRHVGHCHLPQGCHTVCCVVVTQTSYPNKITETSGPRVLGIGLSRDMLAIKSIEAHFGINRVSYHDDVIKWKDFRVTDLCEGKPPVIGGFPSRRPVTWGFDVFFYLCLNELLSKQSRCRWFETPSRSLWHHCNTDLHSGQGIQMTYGWFFYSIAHKTEKHFLSTKAHFNQRVMC